MPLHLSCLGKSVHSQLILVSMLKLCEEIPNPGQKLFVDCEKIGDMPPISFNIGDQAFPLMPEQASLFAGF